MQKNKIKDSLKNSKECKYEMLVNLCENEDSYYIILMKKDWEWVGFGGPSFYHVPFNCWEIDLAYGYWSSHFIRIKKCDQFFVEKIYIYIYIYIMCYFTKLSLINDMERINERIERRVSTT